MADEPDNLGAKLDALVAGLGEPEPTTAEADSTDSADSTDAGPVEAAAPIDATQEAEASLDGAQSLADKLDAMISATAGGEPSEESADAPPDETPEHEALAALDAVEAALDAAASETESPDEVGDGATDTDDDLAGDFASAEDITGEAPSPKPPKPATPTAPASSPKAAAKPAEPSDTLDPELESEIEGDFVSESELHDEPATADAEAQTPTEEPDDSAETELAGDFLSEAELSAADDPTPPIPVEDATDTSTATEAVEPPIAPEQAGDDPEGEFLSEAELLAQVDTELESAAQEQLDQGKSDDDYGALAAMLGVDAEELADVPPVETPDATDDAEDVGAADDLDGAFESLDDMFAEDTPAPCAMDAETDSDEEDVEFDGAFAAPDELDAEEPAGWFEPPDAVAEEAPAVSLPAAKAEDKPIKDGVASKAPDAPEEPAPLTEADTPTGKTSPAELAARLKPHVQRGRTAAVRLRPHLITLARLTLKGTKAGCYYANCPLDFLAEKLAKDDAPAPPIKQYVGLVAAAVLIPGALLLLLGLLG